MLRVCPEKGSPFSTPQIVYCVQERDTKFLEASFLLLGGLLLHGEDFRLLQAPTAGRTEEPSNLLKLWVDLEFLEESLKGQKGDHIVPM